MPDSEGRGDGIRPNMCFTARLDTVRNMALHRPGIECEAGWLHLQAAKGPHHQTPTHSLRYAPKRVTGGNKVSSPELRSGTGKQCFRLFIIIWLRPTRSHQQLFPRYLLNSQLYFIEGRNVHRKQFAEERFLHVPNSWYSTRTDEFDRSLLHAIYLHYLRKLSTTTTALQRASREGA